MQNRLSILQPKHALILLIVLNLFLAFFIGNDYGISWDEPNYTLYGERSYDAYSRGLAGKPLIPEKHIYFFDLRYYGPVYAVLGWRIVHSPISELVGWQQPDLWHLVNFIFFQLSLIALYNIAKRYLNRWMSVGVVLLFLTQPLIFGHAFINPKDIPFMTFFLISIAIGLTMTDQIKNHHQDEKSVSFFDFELIVAILAFLFTLTFVCKDVISSAIGQIISSIYYAPVNSLGGKIFALLANPSNRLPVDNYIHKAVAAHLERIAIVLVFLTITVRKLCFGYAKSKTVALPNFDLKLTISVLAAGIVLGLTTSVRILGPFAGLLIATYALLAYGKKSLPYLIYYFSIAAIVCVWTWPFLWDSPTFHFFESLQVMKNFPFGGEVHFMGDNIQPSNLPWFYVPLLVTLQITEPIIILAWAGFIIVFKDSLKAREEAMKSFIPFAWLILPVGLQILFKSSVYDNFRQFLFILPPMFIFAGKALELIIIWIKRPAFNFAVFVLCLIPGVIGIVSLHPYEYIYYNSFVGGVSGAAGNFETDYWLTSYREAAGYLKDYAPQNSKVLAWGAGYNLHSFSRNDLSVYDFNLEDEVHQPFDYAVITTRFNQNIEQFKDAEIVYEVKKDGVLLAVVKKLSQP